MTKKLFLKIAVLLLPASFYAQLSVTSTSVATQLAQTITGSGVTVSSASLSCGSKGAGTFSYTGSTLNLTSGIILTTGHATDAELPAQVVSVQQSNSHTFSDPDLTHISSQAKYDNCILEFNFVPICNQVSITYVFGSSEYDGYQCSTYNDAFGIFLTGANPSGGNYSAVNIATLPNGTPVSINNVNNGSDACTSAHNPTYYVDNSNGTDVVYEGLTTAITSVKPVVPCSTYFMKIAIADASDKFYDSGIFIGGNAVSCSTAPAASIASTSASSCGANDGTASVTVSNYSATPTYSWSPGGQTSSSLSGLAAGTYTCAVSFTTGCSGVFTNTLTTTVSNTASNFSISVTSSPSQCGGPTGSATVAISGGTAPYNIAWGTTPIQTSTVVSGLNPGTYSVAVHDNAGCFQTKSVNVNITNQNTFADTSIQVCGSNVVLHALSGSAYQWYDTSNVIIPGATSQTYSVNSAANGQHYIVSYKDNTTGCRDSLEVDILAYSVYYNVTPSPACSGGTTGALNVSATGTYTFATYDWNLTGVSTNSATSVPSPIAINSLAAGNYSITITQAGNPSCASTYTTNISATSQPPIEDTITACNLDTLQLNPSILAGSTNNWYTSSSQFLASTAANTSYSVVPNPAQIDGTFYTDTVKSSALCVSVIKMYIQIQSFTANSSIIKQLKCYNDTIGEVKVSVPRETNGPIGKPYIFTWIYPTSYTSPAPVNGGNFPASSTESNLHAGTYTCIVTAGNCTEEVKFAFNNPVKLPNDSIYSYYCPKDSLALLIADSGNTNYVWHPSNSGASVTGDSAHVPVPNVNSYYVTYIHNGCPDTGKIMVTTNTYDAFQPKDMVNVFSPNGDKLNDFFYPFHSSTLSQYQIGKQSESNTYQLTIFDRWGTLMYSATDYNQPWDGKTKSGHNADSGTYFYIVKYKSNCGGSGFEEKKGFVELFR